MGRPVDRAIRIALEVEVEMTGNVRRVANQTGLSYQTILRAMSGQPVYGVTALALAAWYAARGAK